MGDAGGVVGESTGPRSRPPFFVCEDVQKDEDPTQGREKLIGFVTWMQ